MATETAPGPPALRHGTPRAGVRGDGGPRPRRARARAGRQHPLRVRACRCCGTPAPARSAPAAWSCARPSEIYLLSTWDEGVPEEIPHDHLYGITWNPMNYVDGARGHRAPTCEPRRVGTDAMSPLFAQLLPMAFPDAEIVDGGPALRDAERIKTTEEVDAIRAAIEVAEAGAGRGGGRAAARGERARADRRVHGRHGVARRHDAGDAGRRPHHHGRRRSRRPAVTDGCRPVTSWPSTPASSPTATPARWDAPGRSSPNGSAAVAERALRRWERLWERLLDACRPGATGSGLLEAYGAAGEPLPRGRSGAGWASASTTR